MTVYGQGPATPPKPAPLSPGQRRGALIAGGVGFTVMTFGFGLISLMFALVVIFGIIGVVGTAIARYSGMPAGFIEGLNEFVEAFWWVGLVVALLGAAIWAAGYIASIRILRSSGNTRAVAITWSALGIAVAANWLVGFVVTIPANVLSSFPTGDALDGAGIFIAGFVFLIGLAGTVAVGMLAWWWMAHVLRLPPQTDAAGRSV